MTAPINVYAEDLLDNLGATLLAFMTGVRSRQEPHRWAHEGVQPTEAARHRLLVAHEAWFMVADSESPDIARQWFIGANPWLSHQTPAERIRNGDHLAVIGAATAFVNDTGGA